MSLLVGGLTLTNKESKEGAKKKSLTFLSPSFAVHGIQETHKKDRLISPRISRFSSEVFSNKQTHGSLVPLQLSYTQIAQRSQRYVVVA
jgi:hypothetical protein